jgi:Zn-dependent peptidase ImmA (M78 family)
MRRGFKAFAEGMAEKIRSEMGLHPSDPIDAVKIALHLGAQVRSAEELTSLAKLRQLEHVQPGAFSACTFSIAGEHVVVYSPLASLGRRQSDIAHEASHIALGHTMKSIQTIAGLSFYTCDTDEEQEANWLAGCLLLPRRLLYLAARRGLDADAIAKKYHVSESMAAFRLRS